MASDRGLLSYHTYGDPRMPPLILLMGLGLPAAGWPRGFLERLVQKGLYLIAPDNRDSGASPVYTEHVSMARLLTSVVRYVMGGSVSTQYRLEDMARDVEELMDALGIKRAHIAGDSLGGMIAQVFATRSPHRTLSLTCISTATGNPRTGLGNLSAIRALLQTHPEGNDEASLLKYYRHIMDVIGSPGEVYDDSFFEGIIRVTRENGITEECRSRQLMAILASGDRRAQLRQLVTPTLVIHGTADPLLPLRAGKEIAECIEGAQMLAVEGMGHDLPEKRLDMIVEAIAAHCYSRALR